MGTKLNFMSKPDRLLLAHSSILPPARYCSYFNFLFQFLIWPIIFPSHSFLKLSNIITTGFDNNMTNEVKTQWQLKHINQGGRKQDDVLLNYDAFLRYKILAFIQLFSTPLCDVVINISLMVSLVFVINEPGPCKALQITENLSSTYLGTDKPRFKKNVPLNREKILKSIFLLT